MDARKKYHDRLNRINAQITELCVLTRGFVAEGAEPNWSQSGSMGYVIEELDNLIRFVKSGSAIARNDALIERAYDDMLQEQNERAADAARGIL